ncbi:hypothetical protein [Mycobacterium kansasii]|uniref:hypothetical protein n=1 Tax=Mycobacterium kansasii TaxID=1768 RepID=UPI0004D9C360|nr:hypothetical protein [Mycobacterium kansasii]KEP38769.1 hypothetical protein MKSMC1_60590 [Mycobacterium kansasii]
MHTTPASTDPLPVSPADTWKALAPRIAARPKLRTWNPDTNKFDITKNLTTRLPQTPAAVLLYHNQRTHVLALDFDTKRHGQHTVDTDFARALTWITEAGGVTVTDQSTSGGRHILVPLAIGTSATLAEITQLMRLLEARLPSLDKTPMTNPKTGCITVPGSPCRQGGHRILDGPLNAAIDAFTTRSHPALLPRLNVLLGALTPTPTNASASSHAPATTGTGAHARLRPEYTRTGDLPERITAYATTGVLPPDGTWASHSEARQAVLAHAVLHGHSLTTIQALMAPGRPWHRGLATAYTRYRHNATNALQRDFTKALNWAATHSPQFRPPRAQDQVHTRGAAKGPERLRSWLANATAWLDAQYAGHRYRWIGAAVYQALAIHALRSGEVINGVPVVGVGGRALSIATGLLSETTVWEFLRDTRDQPGSPLVRTRVAQGRTPDYYALTSQHRLHVSASVIERQRIEDVHIAWKVIGHRHRRVYELIAHHNLHKPVDIFAAAHISTSTGYSTLAALATAGLIDQRRGEVSLSAITLDDIAAAHQLDQQRSDRIARHQRERTIWHRWLALREDDPTMSGHDENREPTVSETVEAHHDEYLTAVLATGPPARDELDREQRAVELLAQLVGARPVGLLPH